MSTPNARLSVWAGEQSACIRIAGTANFNSSVDFKALINELLKRGCHCFVLDLSECKLMDSTFLGVLAGFGRTLNSGNGHQGRHAIELCNPSERITELLDTMGILPLFTLAQGPLPPPGDCGCHEPAPINPSKVEVTQTCLEAHQVLMEINPANVAKFKDVSQFLAENLKRLKGE